MNGPDHGLMGFPKYLVALSFDFACQCQKQWQESLENVIPCRFNGSTACTYLYWVLVILRSTGTLFEDYLLSEWDRGATRLMTDRWLTDVPFLTKLSRKMEE